MARDAGAGWRWVSAAPRCVVAPRLPASLLPLPRGWHPLPPTSPWHPCLQALVDGKDFPRALADFDFTLKQLPADAEVDRARLLSGGTGHNPLPVGCCYRPPACVSARGAPLPACVRACVPAAGRPTCGRAARLMGDAALPPPCHPQGGGWHTRAWAIGWRRCTTTKLPSPQPPQQGCSQIPTYKTAWGTAMRASVRGSKKRWRRPVL